MNSKVYICFFCFIFCLLNLTSCIKNKTIKLDSNDEAAFVVGVEWAVVSSPYAAFRVDHGFEYVVSSHARQGDVMQIEGCYYQNAKNEEGENVVYTWYKFEKGWLDNTVVEVYDNRLKAQTVSERFDLN